MGVTLVTAEATGLLDLGFDFAQVDRAIPSLAGNPGHWWASNPSNCRTRR